MSNRYDPDNRFMSGFTKVVDTLVLSILWLVCSLPVFTLGAASAAVYYAFHKTIRQDRSYPVKEFFKAFRSNFKQATAAWMILFAFIAASVFACFCLLKLWQSLPAAGVLLAMGTVMILFAVVWCIYIFPYLSRFENTLLNAAKNSAILAISNLLWSVLLLIMLAAAVLLTLWKPAMLAPAAALFIWGQNLILERIFRRLMNHEELLSEREADGV